MVKTGGKCLSSLGPVITSLGFFFNSLKDYYYCYY
jgi:hypothetical protein